jgi:dihydroorotase
MDGRRFNWKVNRTFVNGQTVYADGKVADGVRGMELRFNA